jgi:hypothetical protein
MLSSPGCWAAYCALLAREYEDRAYRTMHRLTVDAYAVQHPGEDTSQARNSVGIHLSRLALILVRGWPIERANNAMVAISAMKMHYPWLTPPQNRGELTVREVLQARNSAEHHVAVRRWAKSVWEAWHEYHATIFTWIEQHQG